MKITLEMPFKIREKTYNKLLNELQSWTQTCKASALKELKNTAGTAGINACKRCSIRDVDETRIYW